MIITEDFVVLNFPKTGSSFTRKVIKQVYARYNRIPFRLMMKLGLMKPRMMTEFIAPLLDLDRMSGMKGQHGTYRQIPPEHRHKKIVSIVRNPFDRYISTYLFRWWERNPLAPIEQLRAVWPHFPNLSFAEYYDMLNGFGRNDRLHGAQLKSNLGYGTVQFVQFYFTDPDHVLGMIDDTYISQKCYLDDMGKVTFLHQENLNQELYDFLLGFGHDQKDIEFIKKAAKVNVTKRSDDQKKAREFYTPELIEQVYERDALLFDIFPEYKNFTSNFEA